MGIIWHRWRDPLAHLVRTPVEDELEEALLRARKDAFLADDEVAFDSSRARHGNTGPAVIGPMGIVPLHEENLPSKLFNFWMGHTDFDLSGPVVERIERVPGVETLDVQTRYRFRLGIGKHFDPPTVRRRIEQVSSKHGALIDMLRTSHEHWALYVMPDGQVETGAGATVSQVKARGNRYLAQAQEVVQSW